MKAGKLRHKITIESKSNTQDAYGALVETWGTHSTAWASIEPITGREYFDQGKVNSEVTTRIRTRHISGVTNLMRVKFGTRIYAIVSVINIDERNKEYELMCKEVT